MKENKMRILHIIHAMDVGGAETFIMNVYRNINREKVQFDFLVNDIGYFDKEIEKLGGIIYKMPYITEVFQLKYSKYLTMFFNEHKEYQIVHSHLDQVTGIILKVAKKCNVKVRIAHSHNTSNSNGIAGKIYKRYIQTMINRNANNYFACSENAARWLFKNNSKKAIVVKNGIDINKFKFNSKKRKSIREELGILEDTHLIGHIGSFREQKNHTFLIDIFNEYVSKYSDSILILVGIGPLEKEIKDKVKKYNLEMKVRFLGLRDDADKLYSSFDILLFPSLHEGLSVAMIEAQASGLNILASNTIDKNSDITENITFMSLDEKADIWSSEINSILERRKTREIDDIIIDKAGYNINKTTKMLEEFYIVKGNE